MNVIRDPYGYLLNIIVNDIISYLDNLGVKLDKREIMYTAKEPPNPKYGDIGVAIHRYSKQVNKNPQELSQSICGIISKHDIIEWCKPLSGYVNTKFIHSKVAKLVIESIKSYDDYGYNPIEKPLRIIVEHTSANPIHPLHIGHGRNAFLGDTLANLLKNRGHIVQTRFYINDAGRQVSILALGYKLLGQPDPPSNTKPDEWLGRVYALTNLLIELKKIKEEIKRIEHTLKVQENNEELKEKYKELLSRQDEIVADISRIWEKDKELFDNLSKAIMEYPGDLEDEINKIMKAYEEGEEWAKKLVRRVVDIGLSGIRETLNILRIDFDKWDYESDLIWNSYVNYILSKVRETPYYILYKGAEAIDLTAISSDPDLRKKLGIILSGEIPPLILRRSDGTTLYTTRDIAYTIYKFKDFNADKVINVIGGEQKLPQMQLKMALYLLGFKKEAENLIPYIYEMVIIPGMKMSSRRYRLITIDWLIEELYQRAKEEVDKRRKDLPEEDRKNIAKEIAIAALKFQMVSSDPKKTLVFSFDKALSLKENSAPYLMYTYARSNSILEKVSNNIPWEDINYEKGVADPIRWKILWLLCKYPWIAGKAADDLSPEILSSYLLELSDIFNKWYSRERILDEKDKELKAFKLALVYGVKKVLGHGLSILGIEALPHI